MYMQRFSRKFSRYQQISQEVCKITESEKNERLLVFQGSLENAQLLWKLLIIENNLTNLFDEQSWTQMTTLWLSIRFKRKKKEYSSQGTKTQLNYNINFFNFALRVQK